MKNVPKHNITIKKELIKDLSIHILIFILLIILIKIIFFKESLFNILKIIGTIYLILIIPGFLIIYLFKNSSFSFFERYILGIALSISSIGLFVYYLNILGINLKVITWTVILINILLALAAMLINFNLIGKNE